MYSELVANFLNQDDKWQFDKHLNIKSLYSVLLMKNAPLF